MNNALAILRQQVGGKLLSTPSPLMRWLDPVVLVAEEGVISFSYTIRLEMTNPMGNLHGGIAAAIADDIIGAAVFSLGEAYFYATLSNTIHYFAPAKLNDTVIADARILKHGRQLINAECEVWNIDRTLLLAKGSSNLIKTKLSK